jgi:methanethiol S-methyltransferase
MGRILALLYGVASYAFFFVTFLYLLGFVEGFVVPKTIDMGEMVSLRESVIVNLGLVAIFGIQHSLMARPGFKDWWIRWVPKPIERSTYVLLASLALALLCWQWRPMPAVLWSVADPMVANAIIGLSLVGWLVVLTSSYLINHFELFGLQQVFNNLRDREMPEPVFRTPFFYKFVRHPIYLGFIIALWAAPTMSAGRLLLAAAMTVYIVIGFLLEERDLVDLFGDDYRRYRERVSALIPWRRSA